MDRVLTRLAFIAQLLLSRRKSLATCNLAYAFRVFLITRETGARLASLVLGAMGVIDT